MADITYFEEGYIEDGYFVYTADAESVFAVEVTQTANAGLLQEVTVNLEGAFSPTVTAGLVKTTDIILDTTVTMLPTVNVQRDANVLLEFFADLNSQAAITRGVQATQDSIFTASVNPTALYDAQGTLASSVTLTVDATSIVMADPIILDSAFTTTAFAISYVKKGPGDYPNNRPADLNYWLDEGTDSFLTYDQWLASSENVATRSFFDTDAYEGSHSFRFVDTQSRGFRTEYNIINTASGTPFIFEFYFKSNDTQNVDHPIASLGTLPRNLSPTGVSLSGGIIIERITINSSVQLRAVISNPASISNPFVITVNPPNFQDDNWHRLALRADGDTYYLVYDNTTLGTRSTSGAGTRIVASDAYLTSKPVELAGSTNYIKFDKWNFRINESGLSNNSSEALNADNTVFDFRFNNDFDDELPGLTIDESAVLQTNTGLIVNAGALQDASATLDTTATLTAVANVNELVDATATLDADSTLTVDGDRVRTVNSTIPLSTAVSAGVNVVKGGAAILDTTAALDAAVERIKQAGASIIAQFNQTADVEVLLGVVATLNSEVTLTANASAFSGATATLDAAFEVDATVSSTFELALELNTAFELQAVTQPVASGLLTLNSQFDILAEGSITQLDYIVYLVPQETRSWAITAEDRTHSVFEEVRINIIQGDN